MKKLLILLPVGAAAAVFFLARGAPPRAVATHRPAVAAAPDPSRLDEFDAESDPEVLFEMSRAMGAGLETPEAREQLFLFLERSDAVHRECGLMAFLGMNQADVADRLLLWLRWDPSPQVRARAAFLLVDVLEELTAEQQSSARAWARESLRSPHACIAIEAFDLLAASDAPAVANAALASGDADRIWNAVRSIAASGSGAEHLAPLLADLEARSTTDATMRDAIEEIRTTLRLR